MSWESLSPLKAGVGLFEILAMMKDQMPLEDTAVDSE